MAFISGPRQCGKTTLSRLISYKYQQAIYKNYDDFNFKKMWTQNPTALLNELQLEHNENKRLLILDEIHKAPKWKTKVKGLFDLYGEDIALIITGSVRLNIFKKGGDSLMGRYYHFRLHPFSLRELIDVTPNTPDLFMSNIQKKPRSSNHQKIVERLFATGGFPEPYLSEDKKIVQLWHQGRKEKIVREDLRDLTRVPDLARVEAMVSLIPEKVGTLFSLTSLREDLEVSVDTVKRWMSFLSELYYLYSIRPYSKSIKRSLAKNPKIYLYDWSELEDEGSRFENMVASHLLKACHFWTDSGEGLFDLFFLRNKDKVEIDFLITRDKKPWFTVECKLNDSTLDINHQVFSKVLKVPHFQITLKEKIFREVLPSVYVISFEYFFREMV